MSYRQVIESIDGWQEMTDAGIIEAAKAKSFFFVYPGNFSLLGVAQVIGKYNVAPFIQFLDGIGFGWMAMQAAAEKLPIGDAKFNAELASIPDPRCQALALAGRRYISPCERFGVPESDQQLQATINQLRLEERRKAIKKQASETYSAFVHSVDQWDGSGQEPSLCGGPQIGN
jgi:hypothetical protein